MAQTAEVLERAVEASEIVRALTPYGVTLSDIATATGVTERAVRAWQTSAIRPERYDRLSELQEVVLLLSEKKGGIRLSTVTTSCSGYEVAGRSSRQGC